MTESFADVKARLLQDPSTRKAYDAMGFPAMRTEEAGMVKLECGLDYSACEVYAESVARGCKPVALVAQWEDLSTEESLETFWHYEEIANRWGLKLFVHTATIDGHPVHEFFFYKHPHLGDVLDELYRHEPSDVLYHWIWGKLFGYSEEEIGDFIQNQEDKGPG